MKTPTRHDERHHRRNRLKGTHQRGARCNGNFWAQARNRCEGGDGKDAEKERCHVMGICPEQCESRELLVHSDEKWPLLPELQVWVGDRECFPCTRDLFLVPKNHEFFRNLDHSLHCLSCLTRNLLTVQQKPTKWAMPPKTNFEIVEIQKKKRQPHSNKKIPTKDDFAALSHWESAVTLALSVHHSLALSVRDNVSLHRCKTASLDRCITASLQHAACIAKIPTHPSQRTIQRTPGLGEKQENCALCAKTEWAPKTDRGNAEESSNKESFGTMET